MNDLDSINNKKELNNILVAIREAVRSVSTRTITNELQEYSITEAAKFFKMKRATFEAEFIHTGKLHLIRRGNQIHVLHRELKEIQDEKLALHKKALVAI